MMGLLVGWLWEQGVPDMLEDTDWEVEGAGWELEWSVAGIGLERAGWELMGCGWELEWCLGGLPCGRLRR